MEDLTEDAEDEVYVETCTHIEGKRWLEGGYEAVPTRDIHMNQIGFDEEWLYVLDFYVRPLQESVFTGYFHKPPRYQG